MENEFDKYKDGVINSYEEFMNQMKSLKEEAKIMMTQGEEIFKRDFHALKIAIKVCDEWRNNYLIFEKWALENGYQKGLTIDRINPDDDYKPSNCRWITRSENSKRVIHKKRG